MTTAASSASRTSGVAAFLAMSSNSLARSSSSGAVRRDSGGLRSKIEKSGMGCSVAWLGGGFNAVDYTVAAGIASGLLAVAVVGRG
jgi:hypothetical protein